jgi:thioredoxin-like negative regulator of GroEL
MEQIAIYLLLGLALSWLSYMVYLWVASQSLRGKDIRHLHSHLQLSDFPEQMLLYCYSPACRPCRGMSPTIDELKSQGDPIFKLDVSQNPQLGKELEIRAVPTLLLIRRGIIEQTAIGAQSRNQIEALLGR